MTPEPGSDRGDAPDPRDGEPGHQERDAAEQGAEPPPQQGVVFNPQSAQPIPPGPYGQPTPPAPASYPQGHPRAYPQGWPQGYAGPAYGGPGQPTPWPGYSTRLRQPQAGTALILGLIGLIGTLFTCGLSLLLSPIAWGVGRFSLTRIRASGGHLSGESDARTGMILGIVGTVLLVIGIIAVSVALVVLLDAGPIPQPRFDEGTEV